MESLTAPVFYRLLEEKFPHEPTRNQERALRQLSDFIIGAHTDRIFLLKGYAGTGKTTLLGTLITNLWHSKKKAVLMAPTGRAAKVMST